jgi:hypothetical protein
MSLALKIPQAAPVEEPAPPPYKLSANELILRREFEGFFNNTRKRGWQLHIAVWNLTEELKRAGALPEAVVKRIKYIAAIPVAFHYRVGYESAHARLKAAANTAISLSIAWYFADESENDRLKSAGEQLKRAGERV